MKRNPPKHDAQIDIFMPIFTDIAARDVQETMELPFFSLSKKPRYESIQYRNEARGLEVLVTGGEPIGIASIWDKDILIWAISQVRETLDRGEEPQPQIYFHPYQLLKSVRRGIRGDDYKRLENAMLRLHNTTIHTSIRTDAVTRKKGFRWIDDYQTARENKTGEAAGLWSITLADWVFKAALNKTLVLTLDDDYFLLTGGLERWLYMIARKHGGRQEHGFTMKMKILYEKCSTVQDYKYFARAIRKIVRENELPGYHLHIHEAQDGEDYINFTRRSNLSFEHPAYQFDMPRIATKRLPKSA